MKRTRCDLFWLIKTPGGHWPMFPKPFECGKVFGTIPQRILEWMDQNVPGGLEGVDPEEQFTNRTSEAMCGAPPPASVAGIGNLFPLGTSVVQAYTVAGNARFLCCLTGYLGRSKPRIVMKPLVPPWA